MVFPRAVSGAVAVEVIWRFVVKPYMFARSSNAITPPGPARSWSVFFTTCMPPAASITGSTATGSAATRTKIDLVAVNDLRKELVIAEIKRNKSRISLPDLQHKAERLLQEYQGYRVEYCALGLEDAVEFLPSKENS